MSCLPCGKLSFISPGQLHLLYSYLKKRAIYAHVQICTIKFLTFKEMEHKHTYGHMLKKSRQGDNSN